MPTGLQMWSSLLVFRVADSTPPLDQNWKVERAALHCCCVKEVIGFGLMTLVLLSESCGCTLPLVGAWVGTANLRCWYVGWDLLRVCITPTLSPEAAVGVRQRKDTSEVFGALCTICLNWVPAEAGGPGF